MDSLNGSEELLIAEKLLCELVVTKAGTCPLSPANTRKGMAFFEKWQDERWIVSFSEFSCSSSSVQSKGPPVVGKTRNRLPLGDDGLRPSAEQFRAEELASQHCPSVEQ
ncbi:hypothetical protein CRG98_035185 [Punica granatum]|uniref:Uncharacterized protein n=1 Tax=Punica granatum TaxID=22663 RepID=A0A2I0IL22_PUNGR|nr:hypothetical protein CRG98_035185 [Punica granatum]